MQKARDNKSPAWTRPNPRAGPGGFGTTVGVVMYAFFDQTCMKRAFGPPSNVTKPPACLGGLGGFVL